MPSKAQLCNRCEEDEEEEDEGGKERRWKWYYEWQWPAAVVAAWRQWAEERLSGPGKQQDSDRLRV